MYNRPFKGLMTLKAARNDPGFVATSHDTFTVKRGSSFTVMFDLNLSENPKFSRRNLYRRIDVRIVPEEVRPKISTKRTTRGCVSFPYLFMGRGVVEGAMSAWSMLRIHKGQNNIVKVESRVRSTKRAFGNVKKTAVSDDGATVKRVSIKYQNEINQECK